MKIANSSLGTQGAEEYKELMKGNSEKKEQAVEMLKKAEQEKEQKKMN